MAFNKIYNADASYDEDFSYDEDDMQNPICKYEHSTLDYNSKTARDQFFEENFGMTEKKHGEDYDDDFEAAGSGVNPHYFHKQHTSYALGKLGSVNYSEEGKEEEDPLED